MANRKRVAVVLAAGASTRMKTERSKILYPMLGKSMAVWALELAKKVCDEVVFVVGHQREAVEAEVRAHSSKTRFAVQTELKGTADAVRVALEAIKELDGNSTDVFIMNGDGVLLTQKSLKALFENHERARALLTVMVSHVDDPAAYGRIIRNAEGVIDRIVEFKDASPQEKSVSEINAGYYLIQLAALRDGIREIMNQTATKEFYLPTLVQLFRKKGFLVRTETLIDFEEALGANNQEELAVMTKIIQQRVNKKWMEAGVTIVDPETTWVDEDVTLEAGVRLEPGVHLRGKTKVAAGATIGAYSIIDESTIGKNAVVESFCHLKGATLGEKSAVGPYARLRMGTVLDKDVHIGNFVEIKKSHCTMV